MHDTVSECYHTSTITHTLSSLDSNFDGLTVAATHGSPWRYDTYVPVIFAGNGLQARRVDRAITPYDIAPTLSAYLGVKPPSGAVGAVLPEVSKTKMAFSTPSDSTWSAVSP